MSATKTTRHHRDCGHQHPEPPRGAPMYYGWSHDEGRMQMMDLPSYVDSFRLGYERAVEDLQGQLTNLAQSMMPGGSAATAWQQYQTLGGQPGARQQGQGHHHHHHHDDDCGCHDHSHRHHDHDCSCGRHDCHDCECTCCIVDADYVVYARCDERRVIPLQVENDTRRAREDVTIDVSEIRTSGGRVLPWKALVLPRESVTLEACSTTEIDLVVEIYCSADKAQDQPKQPARKAAARGEQQQAVVQGRESLGVDVDECEVGYVSIRLEGCLVRPIVVAIAVLPRECDAFHTGCSCSCCC